MYKTLNQILLQNTCIHECLEKRSVFNQYFELERTIYLRFVEVNDYEYD